MSTCDKIRNTITTYCGLDCTGCEFVESQGCKGCIATKGRPFHVSEGQEPCAVAKCAIEHGVTFCGECGEFPCQLLTDFSNDPDYGDNPKGARIENCKRLCAALQKEKEQDT